MAKSFFLILHRIFWKYLKEPFGQFSIWMGFIFEYHAKVVRLKKFLTTPIFEIQFIIKILKNILFKPARMHCLWYKRIGNKILNRMRSLKCIILSWIYLNSLVSSSFIHSIPILVSLLSTMLGIEELVRQKVSPYKSIVHW